MTYASGSAVYKSSHKLGNIEKTTPATAARVAINVAPYHADLLALWN